MFNLHHLKILVTVARLGSYSRAAERLGISQPAVSMQVGKLEEAVGLPLVTHKGRQLSLTEAGETLAAYADRIFQLFDEAANAMDDFRTVRRGRLRVSASSTPGAYILPGLISEFRQESPGVSVALTISNTRDSIRAVAEGMADLAVVGEVPADAPEVEFHPLCADCLAVVVAPGHPWARREITPQELAAEPLVLREEGSSTREVLDRRLATCGVKAKVAFQLGSTEAVKHAVAAGLGAAVLSGWAVRWEVEAGRLVHVKVPGLELGRMLQLVLPRDTSISGPATAFLAKLQAADLSGGCL